MSITYKFTLKKNSNSLKNTRRYLRKKATYSEKVLWQDLRNRRLGGLKFYRQYSIGPFIYDFYCPSKEVAIELDGETHMNPQIQKRDKIKTSYLEENGITLLRFWDDEVFKNYEEVLERILEVCLEK